MLRNTTKCRCGPVENPVLPELARYSHSVQLQVRIDRMRAIVVQDLHEVGLVHVLQTEAVLEMPRSHVDHHTFARRMNGRSNRHRYVDGAATRRADVRDGIRRRLRHLEALGQRERRAIGS